MATTERELRWGRLVVAALFVAASPAWLSWMTSSLQQEDGRPVLMATSSSERPISALPPSALDVIANLELFAHVGSAKADAVSSAEDLKSVFDENKNSPDPRLRRAAARAFQACVPAFLAPGGKAPSTAHLIESLPTDHRRDQELAYRSLFQRCEGFLAVQRSVLTETLQSLSRDARAQMPGVLAQQAAMVGSPERVDTLVKEALTSNDPAAIASLAGLTARLAVIREGRVADAALLQKALAVDEALPLVACDLGLDCGDRSLWALQLCAMEGLCEGDVVTRLTARSARNGVNPDAVEAERVRLVNAVQSGRATGAADLLPDR